MESKLESFHEQISQLGKLRFLRGYRNSSMFKSIDYGFNNTIENLTKEKEEYSEWAMEAEWSPK